jgi:hypothetical protein
MEEQWRKVMFSNDNKFNIVGFDGREYCWKRHGDTLSNLMVSKDVKHEGGSIMAWGSMSWGGHWGVHHKQREQE